MELKPYHQQIGNYSNLLLEYIQDNENVKDNLKYQHSVIFTKGFRLFSEKNLCFHRLQND